MPYCQGSIVKYLCTYEKYTWFDLIWRKVHRIQETLKPSKKNSQRKLRRTSIKELLEKPKRIPKNSGTTLTKSKSTPRDPRPCEWGHWRKREKHWDRWRKGRSDIRFLQQRVHQGGNRQHPNTPEKRIQELAGTYLRHRENTKKKLMKLKISKAPGPNHLHPRLLKELNELISTRETLQPIP